MFNKDCRGAVLYQPLIHLVLWVPPPEESPSLLEAEDLVEDGHRMGPRPLLPPLLLYAVINITAFILSKNINYTCIR